MSDYRLIKEQDVAKAFVQAQYTKLQQEVTTDTENNVCALRSVDRVDSTPVTDPDLLSLRFTRDEYINNQRECYVRLVDCPFSAFIYKDLSHPKYDDLRFGDYVEHLSKGLRDLEPSRKRPPWYFGYYEKAITKFHDDPSKDVLVSFFKSGDHGRTDHGTVYVGKARMDNKTIEDNDDYPPPIWGIDGKYKTDVKLRSGDPHPTIIRYEFTLETGEKVYAPGIPQRYNIISRPRNTGALDIDTHPLQTLLYDKHLSDHSRLGEDGQRWDDSLRHIETAVFYKFDWKILTAAAMSESKARTYYTQEGVVTCQDSESMIFTPMTTDSIIGPCTAHRDREGVFMKPDGKYGFSTAVLSHGSFKSIGDAWNSPPKLRFGKTYMSNLNLQLVSQGSVIELGGKHYNTLTVYNLHGDAHVKIGDTIKGTSLHKVVLEFMSDDLIHSQCSHQLIGVLNPLIMVGKGQHPILDQSVGPESQDQDVPESRLMEKEDSSVVLLADVSKGADSEGRYQAAAYAYKESLV